VERVSSIQLGNFYRRFRFQKGMLKRVVFINDSPQESRVRIALHVTESATGQKVLLKLELRGIEEFRFQRRPVGGLVRLNEVRFGYFNSVIYLNFDAFADEASPQLMDFRASDAYFGARELSYEIKTKPTSPKN
jgi:hypothetical protein